MQLAISRKREFLADATAVQFTRNPDGLISALQKLDDDNSKFQYANNATAHMYIVSLFKNNNKNKKALQACFLLILVLKIELKHYEI